LAGQVREHGLCLFLPRVQRKIKGAWLRFLDFSAFLTLGEQRIGDETQTEGQDPESAATVVEKAPEAEARKPNRAKRKPKN